MNIGDQVRIKHECLSTWEQEAVGIDPAAGPIIRLFNSFGIPSATVCSSSGSYWTRPLESLEPVESNQHYGTYKE